MLSPTDSAKNAMDIFPRTEKVKKVPLTYSNERRCKKQDIYTLKMSLDINPSHISHVKTILLMSMVKE